MKFGARLHTTTVHGGAGGSAGRCRRGHLETDPRQVPYRITECCARAYGSAKAASSTAHQDRAGQAKAAAHIGLGMARWVCALGEVRIGVAGASGSSMVCSILGQCRIVHAHAPRRRATNNTGRHYNAVVTVVSEAMAGPQRAKGGAAPGPDTIYVGGSACVGRVDYMPAECQLKQLAGCAAGTVELAQPPTACV